MTNEQIKELINRRRNQIIIHSIIYYRLGDSVTDDKIFDSWAYELADLQKQYPNIAKECKYAETFEGFDGTTGYNLDILGDPHMMSKAKYIMEISKEKSEINI